jgi:hypothetical protein
MTNAREFTTRLTDLLRRERTAMADFLLVLADFDRQELWRELGHASLFSFLRRALGLSAGAAQYRKTAAELVQRFPTVEAALRDGRLCLSSVIEVGKVITPENCAAVLPRFFGLSSRDAAFVVASIRPVSDPPRRDVVTPLRPGAAAPPLDACPIPADDDSSLPFRASEMNSAVTPLAPASLRADSPGEPTPCAPAAPHVSAATTRQQAAKPMTIEPLTADLSRLHVTVSRRFLAKLEAARAALSHSRPGATAEDILEAGLELVLAKDAKKKALVEKPRKTTREVTSDVVPAAVRREVWRRAGECCEWPVETGGVCGSTLRLELDHIVPRALGGPSTVDNLRVVCRVHNDYAARGVFGDEWMDRYARRRGAAAEAARP